MIERRFAADRCLFEVGVAEVGPAPLARAVLGHIRQVGGSAGAVEYSAYPSIVEWCANTTDTYPKQDIEAAKKVLEDAGYTKDANGFYVTGIEWDVFEGMQDMANLIRSAAVPE
mgnify:CR=1 FL=1